MILTEQINTTLVKYYVYTFPLYIACTNTNHMRECLNTVSLTTQSRMFVANHIWWDLWQNIRSAHAININI
jgi:hypothetical protein